MFTKNRHHRHPEYEYLSPCPCLSGVLQYSIVSLPPHTDYPSVRCKSSERGILWWAALKRRKEEQQIKKGLSNHETKTVLVLQIFKPSITLGDQSPPTDQSAREVFCFFVLRLSPAFPASWSTPVHYRFPAQRE